MSIRKGGVQGLYLDESKFIKEQIIMIYCKVNRCPKKKNYIITYSQFNA